MHFTFKGLQPESNQEISMYLQYYTMAWRSERIYSQNVVLVQV